MILNGIWVEINLRGTGNRAKTFKWLIKSFWSKFESDLLSAPYLKWGSVTCARNFNSKMKHSIDAVQNIMSAQNQLWSKRQKPFSCPAFFCPPVIIRTMLELNIMLAIWPFTLSPVSEIAAWCNVLYERAPLLKSSSVKQCSLWEARNCNNKEIERARKAKKQQN